MKNLKLSEKIQMPGEEINQDFHTEIQLTVISQHIQMSNWLEQDII